MASLYSDLTSAYVDHSRVFDKVYQFDMTSPYLYPTSAYVGHSRVFNKVYQSDMTSPYVDLTLASQVYTCVFIVDGYDIYREC